MRTVAVTLVLTIALVAPASAQWVYFSHFPRACLVDYVYDLETTGIYVKAPSTALTTGASFRLDLNGLGPEDIVSVTAADGVAIVGGTVVDGITLAWPQRVLDHAAVLWIAVANNPPANDTDPPWEPPHIATRDVILFTPDGNEALEDVTTGINILLHCWDPTAWITGPDTVDVVIGHCTQFQVTADMSAEYAIGASVYADDDLGWLADSLVGAVTAACPVCPWDVVAMSISVDTPDYITPGALNMCRIWADYNGNIGGHDVVLRATQPIALEPTSFGRLKALYRGDGRN